MSRPLRVLGAAAVGVAAWSTLVEPRLFTVRRHALPLLPEGAAPLRVLQLSDIHLAPWQHGKIAWVRQLVELRPDLLVLTGDLMGHIHARGPLLHALRPFSEAGIPTVFVHGSNDYYGPTLKNPLKYLREPSRLSTRRQDIDNAALTRGLTDLGFTDLNNSATQLSVRGSQLSFFGLGDPHIRYDRPEQMRAALGELLKSSDGGPETAPRAEVRDDAAMSDDAAARNSTDPAAPQVRIGVVHAPYQSALNTLIDSALPGGGADLILAGHTHGGQVRMPGVGALTSNCDLSVKQARGLSVWYDAERAAYLNVSAGLGASIYAPIRFACRPEASLITLEPARG